MLTVASIWWEYGTVAFLNTEPLGTSIRGVCTRDRSAISRYRKNCKHSWGLRAERYFQAIFIYILLVVGESERTDGIVHCFGVRQAAIKHSVQHFFIVSGLVVPECLGTRECSI
jgi:hypothetical protein